VKDLKAGKLDARTQQGHFVGYDSKSKGYRIYWPTKRSITAKRNVVFNGNDIQATESSTTFSVGVQSEGERDKVIQYPENHKEHPKEVQNQQNEPIDESAEKGDPKTTNTVPFPPIPDPTVEAENVDEDIQQYGRGHHPRKQQGAYRDMNEGLTAAMAHCEDLIEDESFSVGAENEIGGSLDDLPPDFALVGSIGSDPQMLDEALRGPDAKQWQEALEYEIGQLVKLETWEVTDLPPGHPYRNTL